MLRQILALAVLTTGAYAADNPWPARNLYAGNTVQFLHTSPLMSGEQVRGMASAGTISKVEKVHGNHVLVRVQGVRGWTRKGNLRRYHTPAECEARRRDWVPDRSSRCPAPRSMLQRSFSEDGPEYLFKVCVNHAERPGSRSAQYGWQARNFNIPGVCYRKSD